MNGSFWRRATSMLAVLGVSFSTVSIASAPMSSAVVGGAPISVEQAPWQALVIVEPENRLCGGSLIDPGWIVTAAHCVSGFNGNQLSVHLGISSLTERGSGNEVEVSEVIVHPSWESTSFRNDIALLRLSTPLATGPRISTIRLPVGLDSTTWPGPGTPATISGWGATEVGGQPSNQLRRGEVEILTGPGNSLCGQYAGNFDAALEICAGLPAGGVDSCQGDSGSPLIVDEGGTQLLAGLTSVGFECARADYPGIYTRVTTFVTWLQQYLPAAASQPSVPQNVTVQSLAGGRLQVQWEAPTVGLQPVGYRAVAQPSGQQCQTDGLARTCVIEGLPAGTLYEVQLAAQLSTGAEALAEPVQAVAVDGVTSTGVVVKPKRLAQWADLTLRARDDVRVVVRPSSGDRCARVGSATKPRGVRAKSQGLCAVRVTVITPNGQTRKSIAYLEIR